VLPPIVISIAWIGMELSRLCGAPCSGRWRSPACGSSPGACLTACDASRCALRSAPCDRICGPGSGSVKWNDAPATRARTTAATVCGTWTGWSATWNGATANCAAAKNCACVP
jgi:hypothetical protein